MHSEKMKEVLEQNIAMEERRKQEYFKRQAEADERKRELEKIHEQ